MVMMSGLPGGCRRTALPPGSSRPGRRRTEEILRYQWKAAVPVWKALAARARDHGVKRIALEFHGWQLVYNVETLRRLRSEVGDDILGVNLDPSHLFWWGRTRGGARALADCIYHVHIKDVRLEPAAGQNTLLDTKGVLEFASRSWNFVTPGTGPRRRLVAPLSGDAAGLRLRRRPQHRTRRITPSRWRRPCRRPCPCCGRRCPPEIRKAPPHERGGAFFRTGSPPGNSSTG